MLPPEAILMFMFRVPTKDHVDVRGPCCLLCHAGIHGPAAQVEAMLMFMAQADTKGHDGVCVCGIFFLLLFWGRSQGWEWTWEDWEENVIGVHNVKFPNNQ